MKVVVTGGAGFIGSHIVEYWCAAGADVHVIDNLRSGHLKNITPFSGVKYHNVSITDRETMFDILEGAEYIHHLAALISVPESMEKPQMCVDINVSGLLNILDAAVKHKAKKIVHSSSAAIYGDNPVSIKTTDLVPSPKSPYGITKLDGEYYLKMYNESYGLGAVSLRYFNVFGPRQDPQSQYAAAIPIILKRAMKDEPIIIYGDGEQTRDFVFVKDVVAANVLSVTNTQVNGVFNVANGSAISINELAQIIIQETGSKSKIVYEPERSGDIKHSLASIEQTKSLLRYNPAYDLKSGLRETIHFFMDNF